MGFCGGDCADNPVVMVRILVCGSWGIYSTPAVPDVSYRPSAPRDAEHLGENPHIVRANFRVERPTRFT